MSRDLFLDTAYLIALAAVGDQYHSVAQGHWAKLAGASPALITTDYVLCEVVSYFQKRRDHAKAVRLGEFLMRGPEIELIRVDEGLLAASWDYLVRRPDKSYSLTDCVSFVLMGRLGLRAALTFDRHFLQAGFEVQP